MILVLVISWPPFVGSSVRFGKDLCRFGFAGQALGGRTRVFLIFMTLCLLTLIYILRREGEWYCVLWAHSHTRAF